MSVESSADLLICTFKVAELRQIARMNGTPYAREMRKAELGRTLAGLGYTPSRVREELAR